MTYTITAQDGTSDTITPVTIDGWTPEAESGNEIHKLIAPGTIAVTLVGDYPRTGELTLVFDNDTDAEAARLILGRRTSFTLVSDDRPVTNMSFVRQGRITSAIHDMVHHVWVFSVGYQEIEP